MKLAPFSVSELNNYISRIIISDAILYNISLEGEVSNIKYHSNGNVYLSLKDDNSLINGVIFYDRTLDLEVKIEDGIKLEVRGYIDYFKRNGNCQIIIEEVLISGEGIYSERIKKLKEKLEKEGIFDEQRKKKIPYNPERIGIVTSNTGAAIKDIIQNIRRKNELVDIIIFPTLVQGNRAEEEISEAIESLDRKNLDIIIVGRGGGSKEDLDVFNSEKVLRSIFNSKTPIISAIGHEIDNTLADLVSDKRESTPSLAAEKIVIGTNELRTKLEQIRIDMHNRIENKIEKEIHKLEKIRIGLDLLNPLYNIKNMELRLDYYFENLNRAISRKLFTEENKLREINAKIENLNPDKIMGRGYSIVQNKLGKVIFDTKDIELGEKLEIILSNGKLEVIVKDKKS